MLSKDKNPAANYISAWLFISAGLVFLMVVIGGLTRLTESGLSIVDWQPVKGILPPLSAADWLELFRHYRQSPQYTKINLGMSLQEFKDIFWLEYIHRLLGRIAGMIFLLPLLFFAITKKINRKLALRLATIFLLGALQGFIGWYMVKSGLVDDPRVSHYRLALHLLTAFIIYALVFITALDIKFAGHLGWKTMEPILPHIPRRRYEKEDHKIKLERLFYCSLLITFTILWQVMFGAFVAGTHAGLIYNTFPLMGNSFSPSEAFFLTPIWHNFFKNPTTIQFEHRLIAMILFISILNFYIQGNKYLKINKIYLFKPALALLLLAVTIQFSLGIATLLTHVSLIFASLHQAFAVILFSVSLFINHRLYAIKNA